MSTDLWALPALGDECTVELRLRYRLEQAGRWAPSLSFDRELSISEPFIGLGGTKDVMDEYAVKYVPVNVFDWQSGIRELHIAKHGLSVADTFEFGRKDGDMMACPLQALSRSDGLIAGPPCPPWSSAGQRRARDDPRVEPFDRLLLWLQRLYMQGLLFSILENVPHIYSLQTARAASAMGILSSSS